MIAAFPCKGCGTVPSQLLWKACQASQGKVWRDRVLSEEAFADHEFPPESRWFIEFAKARQLERVDPATALGHLEAALGQTVEEEDRLAVITSICDHCLSSGSELPLDHLNALVTALHEGGLPRDSAIDKLYVCCLCLEALGDRDRLIDMAARLCDLALTPPQEEEVREYLEAEEAERQSEGPLIELLREGEAPARTLQIERGRFWFSGFEFLCNVILICAELIEEEPWRWGFLQPRFSEWLEGYERFQARHGLSPCDDGEMLRHLLSLIE
jgi:hypothetical protein